MYEFFKRAADIVLAVLGLIVFLPIFLIVAILIKITSKGSVFVEYSNRVGRNGEIFRMYKFRSMIANSHELIRNSPEFKKLFEEYKRNSFKLDKDPRVTGVGKILRKTSIDEFPQFLNVLLGQMSLIGPRAYYPDELEEQRKKHPNCENLVKQALTAKPGITGLWQVSGRSRIGFEQRIVLDAKYATSKSIILDLVILLKTPFAIVKGEGINGN